MEYNVDENGYYGTFGGAYIPEILYANVETLRNNYLNIISEEGFQKELDTLMRDYVGRPSRYTMQGGFRKNTVRKSTSSART